mgnify:CR=1 FL=1
MKLPPELQNPKFDGLESVISTIQYAISLEDIDSNYYGILCLKNINTFLTIEPYKLVWELNKLNIPSMLCGLLQKHISDPKLVNEILLILVNISYNTNDEIRAINSEGYDFDVKGNIFAELLKL